MKKFLVLVLITISSIAHAEKQGEADGISYGILCISGYLFVYAKKDSYHGGVGLTQIFKPAEGDYYSNLVVPCQDVGEQTK